MSNSAISILVVDDEPFMHKLLALMLVELGFSSVASCESGPAALQWVEGWNERIRELETGIS